MFLVTLEHVVPYTSILILFSERAVLMCHFDIYWASYFAYQDKYETQLNDLHLKVAKCLGGCH